VRMRRYEVTEMYALIDISNQMLAVIGSPSHIMGASASGSFAWRAGALGARQFWRAAPRHRAA